MKSIFKTSFFLTLFLFSLTIKSQNDTTEIIILHTNDMHAMIDNFSKLASLAEEYRKNYENVFLFSAGDLFTGNPIVDQYKHKGLPIVELMNKVQYDLSCIGNHEFDYGQKEFISLMNIASFPFICSNINISEHSDLKSKKGYIKLYTKDNVSIGVLGLIQIEKNHYPACNPENLYGLSFDDPIKTARKFKTYKDSTDIFIALTHLGFEQDKKLAKKNQFFDVIIGGHSHTELNQGHIKGNTLIVQAGSYLNYAGVLKIKISDHKIISKSDTLINLNSYDKYNEETAKIINAYNDNPDFDEVIGFAKNDITGNDELGALMTDAMQDTMGVDISFQNIGGIRLDKIPSGDITIKQIFELSPFGNTFVVYKLNTGQIKKLIKYSYKLQNSNEIQVNGIQIDLHVKENNKIKKIILKNSDDSKLENKTYTVAVNSYMAAAYELNFLKDETKKGIIDAGCSGNFIKKYKTIDYKGVKRVNIVKATYND